MKQLIIKITDKNRQPLVELYKNLEADLVRELSEVRNALTELTGDKSYISNGVDGYNKEWTWIQKTRFVINKNRRPMSTTEIANEIVHKYEPERRDDRKQVVSAISSIISTNQNPEDGQFVKAESERQGENKYGLFEWDRGVEDFKPVINIPRTVVSPPKIDEDDGLPF